MADRSRENSPPLVTLSPRYAKASPPSSPTHEEYLKQTLLHTTRNRPSFPRSPPTIDSHVVEEKVAEKLKHFKTAPKQIKLNTQPFTLSKHPEFTHHKTTHSEATSRFYEEKKQLIRARKESDDKLKRTLQALRQSITGDAEQRKFAVDQMKLFDSQDISKELKNEKPKKSYSPKEKNEQYSKIEPRYLETKKKNTNPTKVNQQPTFYTKNRNVPSRLLSHFEKKDTTIKTARQEIEERKAKEKQKLKGAPAMTNNADTHNKTASVTKATPSKAPHTPRTPRTPRSAPGSSRTPKSAPAGGTRHVVISPKKSTARNLLTEFENGKVESPQKQESEESVDRETVVAESIENNSLVENKTPNDKIESNTMPIQQSDAAEEDQPELESRKEDNDNSTEKESTENIPAINTETTAEEEEKEKVTN